MAVTLQVWSEPSMVEAGAYEFADTAKFLAAGDNLCVCVCVCVHVLILRLYGTGIRMRVFQR